MHTNPWVRTYEALIGQPVWLLGPLLIAALVAGYHATNFRFDASSETLVVENDPDLLAYERIAKTFSGDDFLLLTFEPTDGNPFTTDNLATLDALTQALGSLEGVANTFSALDLPLLKSPPVALSELSEGFKTLRDSGVPLTLAKEELTSSPLFSQLLISKDGRSTAIQINLETARDQEAADSADGATPREQYLAQRDALISQVRGIQQQFADQGTLFLGGVPMIAADMIAYVRKDLMLFGGTVVVLMMAALYGFFRRPRWVVLPLATSALTVLITVGILGYLDKPATVISSNFIALLAIITISLTIHLIQRYRELLFEEPEQPHAQRVCETMISKFAPCLYTSITTIAAFGSLMASRIVPVEDFGWMMCVGIAVGFVVTFVFFPAALMLLPAGTPSVTLGNQNGLTRMFGQWSRWRSPLIILLSALLTIVVGNGITQLSLDNRFVDTSTRIPRFIRACSTSTSSSAAPFRSTWC